MKIDLINIGNELLNGKRINSHLQYIGNAFHQYGHELHRSIIIPDTQAAITQAVTQSLSEADLILCTGGLGPTSDDCTREVVADVLKAPLQYQESQASHIRGIYARRGRPINAISLKQAYIPQGATLLPNHKGTAPGIFALYNSKPIVLLPGPSHEMVAMFEEEVIPRLKDMGLLENKTSYLQIRTCGIGESILQELSDQIVSGLHPAPDVAFCAHPNQVDIRLSDPTNQLSSVELQEIGQRYRLALREDFVCYGEQDIAAIVIEQLQQQNSSLSVAESCTGGLLSHVITNIPGVSSTYHGGIISYSNDAKIEMLKIPEDLIQQHGAISSDCAEAMASACAERFESDYALSITGNAGPSTDPNCSHPVGTIFVGLHSPIGIYSQRFQLSGDRQLIKERAVVSALDWIRRRLNKSEIEDIWDSTKAPFLTT